MTNLALTTVGPFEVTAVDLDDGWLRVQFAGGSHADFHFRWLRHNAADDLHPLTRERTRCSSEIAADVKPLSVAASEGDLVVRWEERATTVRYAGPWLAKHAYAWNREARPRPSSDLAPVTLDASKHASLRELVSAAGPILRQHGLVVVRSRLPRAPAPEDETERLIDALGEVGFETTSTHFGRIEDLRTDNSTNDNTDQLGYTDAGIELHTDQAFLDEPPRYQLLQSIRRATSGGENFFVDGLAAARYLGGIDERDLEILRLTAVRFHRKQRNFEKIFEGPLVVLEPGRFLVRASYFTLAPHRLPFAHTEAFYRAHDRFVAILRDRRHQRRLTLDAGEWVLYDNHRTLHGRTAFTGPRWVRGIYFDPR